MEERNDLKKWSQKWEAVPADEKLPICIIGAGGVVKSHHLPSYKALGLEVYGIYDVNFESAKKLCEEFNVKSFESLETMIHEVVDKFGNKVIYDIATPPHTFLDLLAKLPKSSKILLQKPMGKSIKEANEIYAFAKKQDLTVAMNLQGRFAPAMLLVKRAIEENVMGQIHDLTCTENTLTPWNLWPWLQKEEKMEVMFHSIHVIDLFRHFLEKDPFDVYCKAIHSPEYEGLKDSRSSIIMNFGDNIMARINTNHSFQGLPEKACSQIQIDGTKASAIIRMGGNLNYPYGIDDQLLFSYDKKTWTEIPLIGNWFPNAFEGPMSNLQRYVLGKDSKLITSLENCIGTMQVVDTCYLSSKEGGTPLLRSIVDFEKVGNINQRLWNSIDQDKIDSLPKESFKFIEDMINREESLELIKSYNTSSTKKDESIPKISHVKGSNSEKQIIEDCKFGLKNGYTCFCVELADDMTKNMELLRTVREQIGQENRLCLNAKQRWVQSEAIENIKKLSAFNLYWIEQPTLEFDVLGYSAIARAIHPVKIAASLTQSSSIILLKQLIQTSSVSFCQIPSQKIGDEILTLLLASKFGLACFISESESQSKLNQPLRGSFNNVLVGKCISEDFTLNKLSQRAKVRDCL